MIKSILSRINKFVSDVIDKVKKKEPWYKYYDKGGKIDYPDLTIYELIEKTCEAYPNNYAFEYYGNKITYREFLVRIKPEIGSFDKAEIGPSVQWEPSHYLYNDNIIAKVYTVVNTVFAVRRV